ncbi:GNAT family N-acetyltransferase [Marinomonas sp. SM2066]|uniref:GNAT family N-acetyltransferase n=2 Tax=Marinomonas colpomeniae TaxID=2774408 RepID=A0ABR8NYH3_9GAMM|nr:GNAT family N-acetyltransferase [Marinomonas colpomeniae]
MDIRKAELNDLTPVVTIFEQYRDFYRCENNTELATDFIKSRIEQKESVIFIAEVLNNGEKTIVGFTQLYPLFSSTAMKKLWLLNDLFVDVNYRKQGIAEQLIAASKALAKETDARGLMLETSSNNLPAQALYEKVGFTQSQSFYYELDV